MPQNEIPRIQPSQYSEALNAKIAEIKQKYFTGNAAKTVFFNIAYGKGKTRAGRTKNDWFDLINNVLKNTDANIVINKGYSQWDTGVNEGVEKLYARLRKANPSAASRIIEVEADGDKDILRLMAVVPLADAVVTENSGVTHLADLMGRPCASYMDVSYLKYMSRNVAILPSHADYINRIVAKFLAKSGIEVKNSADNTYAPLSLTVWNKIFFFLPESWVRVVVGPALETVIAYPVCIASMAGWNAPAEWFINLHGGTDHQKEIRRQGLADMRRGTLFALALGAYAAIASIAASFGIDIPDVFTAGSAVAVVLKAALFGGAISNFLSHAIHNYFNPHASLDISNRDERADRLDEHWDLKGEASPKNILSREERAKIKEVVWSIPSDRLSWPLLKNSMLFARIEELFPNARIRIFTNSNQSLVDGIATGTRTQVISALRNAAGDLLNGEYHNALSQLKPGSLLIESSGAEIRDDDVSLPGVSVLGLFNGYCLSFKNNANAQNAEFIFSKNALSDDHRPGAYFRLFARSLRDLGISEIPADEIPLFKEEQYSETLKNKITELREKYLPENKSKVVFFNTGWSMGATRQGRSISDWFEMIEQVLQRTDAKVVINMGLSASEDEVADLYRRLLRQHPEAASRIIEIPSEAHGNDIVRLMAVMAMSDVVITENSGVTHLADYMGKPCASFQRPEFARYFSGRIHVLNDFKLSWQREIEEFLADQGIKATDGRLSTPLIGAPLSLALWNKIFFFLPESWVRVVVGPALETVIAYPVCIASMAGWNAPAEWFINLHGGTDYQKEIRLQGLADMERGTLFGRLRLACMPR